MDISNLSGILQTLYATQGIGTSISGSNVYFSNYLQNALQQIGTTFTAGNDVVMGYPPAYAASYQVETDKNTAEMTLDEYKQYISNKVSQLPVSTGMRLYGSGTLIFKEEALQSMKENPKYEEQVLKMLEEEFAQEISGYSTITKCRVIGSSEEECYSVQGLAASGYNSLYGLQSRLSDYSLYGSEAGLYGSGISALGLSSSLYNLSTTASASAATTTEDKLSAYRNHISAKKERTHTRLFGRSWDA